MAGSYAQGDSCRPQFSPARTSGLAANASDRMMLCPAPDGRVTAGVAIAPVVASWLIPGEHGPDVGAHLAVGEAEAVNADRGHGLSYPP